MRTTVRLLVAAALAVPVVTAAAPADCKLPKVEAEEPRAASCNLTLVGALEVSETGGLGQVAVHGDLAAVVQRDDGKVALVDISDPTAPTVLGRYDGGTGQASLDHPLDGDVAFSDDGTILLYARQTSDSSNEGLHVLDVTDPSDPVRTDLNNQGGMLRVAYATVGDTEVVVTQDAIVGTTIFEVARTDLGAKVVPIWVDPLPALKVGGPASAGIHIDPADPILGVPVLYLTDGETGLRVLDISDLTRPVELGTWADQGLAAIVVDTTADTRTVHAASEYWFDKGAVPELLTLDVTDPGAITETARRNLGEYEGEVAWKLGGMDLATDGRLHLAHGHAGMVTLDLATGTVVQHTTDLGDPNPPTTTYRGLPWYAMDVLVHGDLLLVTDAVTGELRVFAQG